MPKKTKNILEKVHKTPIILQVQDELPNKKFDDIHPNLMQMPSMTLIVGSIRSGKCLYEYSLVETKDGFKYIKDVCINEYVNSKNGYVKIKDIINTGKKRCYKIKINNNDLILTEEHKLETINGMKQLKDIDSDLIITKYGNCKIISKEYYGFVNTYDLEIDHIEHTFYCNNISVSNSNLLVNLFCNEGFYKDKFDIVRFISNTLHTDNKGMILSKYFDCSDHYTDQMIHDIKNEQMMYDKIDRPTFALVLDDILTQDFSKNNAVSYFATRFRHYIDMFVLTTQSFRSVSTLIRSNCTNVIVCRQQNQKELLKIAEEYGPMVGGEDSFIELYKQCHNERYQMMTIDLQSNPARVFRNFDELIWNGADHENEITETENL
jgi:hypothetical protein